MLNRNSVMINYPQTPAPMRNSNFLMSAAAVLETPTLLKKPASSTNTGAPTTLQPPSAASAVAMQFMMMNQMHHSAVTSAAISSGSCATPFHRNVGVGKSPGFNYAVPSVPDSTTTTVATRFFENLQISNPVEVRKRKSDENQPPGKSSVKRVAFEPLPLKPRNQQNGAKGQSKPVLCAITAGPSTAAKPLAELDKPNPNKLRILTGSVEHIMKLSKSAHEGPPPLVEVFANVLSVKSGSSYECEKMLLLRNRSGGPVMQGVFYEIDFRMPTVGVGDLVRCVGRLTNGSRLQILKITQASEDEERMAQRLQTGNEQMMNQLEYLVDVQLRSIFFEYYL